MDVTERGALAAVEILKTIGSMTHYGIKGMKWGVRKDGGGNSGLGPGEVVTSQRKPGAKIESRGGAGKYASDDASKAARGQQVIKKSGVAALSNKELQDVVTRMNLEQQYSKLSVAQKSKGQKFVSDLLFNAGKQQAQVFVNQQVGQAVGSYMGKKATRG